MKYVVTGGAGFIGSNLVDKLIEEKNEVIVIDNFSTGKKENCNPNVEYLDLDISKTENNNLIKEALLGCDSVFHCAALARVQPSIKDPIKYEINNTIGIVNMLKSACLQILVVGLISNFLGIFIVLPPNLPEIIFI